MSLNYRSQKSAGFADAAKSITGSGFLRKHGNYIGGGFSILWVCLSIISLYQVYKMDRSNPNKKYYLGGSIITLLLILVTNIYYFIAKNNATEPEKEGQVKLIYANLSLIPIYLIITIIALSIIFNVK